ncbi:MULTISPECIES: heavy metal sensor histidine kinase [Pseudomonas]|uniref:Sensor protein n=1 Tax=Pseudomonas tritici TaxID=2745518 RepID=A0A8H9Z4Q1_9PSED|nr:MULTISPECIES: heavy metal sensor histidine kinase [Pseudomonas]MBP2872186.1 heavy metal sensor histidine kinase [Pseudomonas sp. SWRI144]MBW8126276.1 heavy metal sensor histidine kinase [Pseudomonas sp. LAP_36]MBW8136109.1 heavy metal sensor histidine kinase [Pseudomonas sp. PAMC 26818]QXH85571.1 heavy metal sensor histidine kinase [Pseudomonas tritici]CRM17253.1 Sensor kinase CusS [Pseudomonas sp. 35 E 8]
MIKRLSLASRLALLFAACTAVVSLIAGVLFNHASEAHFIELDQQQLDSQLVALRSTLQGVDSPDAFARHEAQLRAELNRQPELRLRITAAGQRWLDDAPGVSLPDAPGLHSLQNAGTDYRVYNAPLRADPPDSPQLTLMLDITHHQHFLQRMQHLIWLTVGLSALATALLGAWAARSGLRPLRRMGEVAAGVSAHSLTQRLPQQHMPVELAELAQAFNAMLGRLDDAFQRLSAFSADIAHELRTPLSNLLTHTQVILTQPRPLEDYREALHSNLEELQWMAQLVNDMLYLAKADHGLLMPKREPLALADEVDALLEFFALLAEDAQVSLIREGTAHTLGDRGMLRRALSNLLDNALRFTPAGGEVRVRMTDGVRLTVENTGEGVPPELLPKLFDRFYRADPARHEGSSEHAGLGLAITQSIVRAHGGRIFCESEAGLTRFVIELPKGD